MKRIYVGKEGSGKTLMMGRESERIVIRNEKLYKKVGIMRPIVSNVRYSDEFIEWANLKGVPIVFWKNVEELEDFSECDLIIDEIGTYFDSRTYADLPLNTRLWLAQAQKLGVQIIGGAQDWAQIDVSFRRLVNELIEVNKFLGSRRPSRTLPGGKYPWALLVLTSLEPVASANPEDLRSLHIIPAYLNPLNYRLALRADTDRFDTNARVLKSDPPPLRKIVRVCHEDGHRQIRYV